MLNIKLDSRLSAVASFIRPNTIVADIGTDHAYLLAYLLQNGIIKNGIAADVKQGPLDNAKKTLSDCDLLDNVKLILSNGLDEISEGECNEIIFAGMGGILISELLERTPWIFKEDIHIIAQPMTHAEVLRKFLLSKGFFIQEEKAATDGKRKYCVISAYYSGKIKSVPQWYYYVGELYKNSDAQSIAYIEKVISSLEKKLGGLLISGAEDNENIKDILNSLNDLLRVMKNDKG